MATNMPVRVGADHKLVTVIGIDAASGIAIAQDPLGARYQVRLDIKRAKGFGPQPGEQWAIDREFGVWTFAAIYGYGDDRATTDYASGGSGSGGTANLNPFIWDQQSAQMVWNVPHNLGRNPQVTVTDGAHTTLLCDIAYPDLNNVTVTHSEPISGYAICL